MIETELQPGTRIRFVNRILRQTEHGPLLTLMADWGDEGEFLEYAPLDHGKKPPYVVGVKTPINPQFRFRVSREEFEVING